MTTITVTVTDYRSREVVHTETRRAWNAGVRASEAFLRNFAREQGTPFEGGHPTVVGGKPGTPGACYTRSWYDGYGLRFVATIAAPAGQSE